MSVLRLIITLFVILMPVDIFATPIPPPDA